MAKKNYKKLIEDMLGKIDNGEPIQESRIMYNEDHDERMLPTLEQQLRERNHSLGESPIFPESDERHFEEKLMADRFTSIVKEVKRHFNTNEIDNMGVMMEMGNMIKECMGIEKANKKQLEELAIQMIREEYNIPEDLVEIEAELTDKIDLEGTQINATPTTLEEAEFDSHDQISEANANVYKRRALNCMAQGSAMKTNHMFHLVDEELTDIDPTLPTKYGKMMSAADYMYFVVDNIDNSPKVDGGVVRVELPTYEGGIPKIKAQAMVFPVLIHELVKGVMEILSAHGLPQEPKLREYVMGKADYLKAEPWDMRMGPAIWSKFVNHFEPEDFNLKHHVFADLASLPAEEFNTTMKEILSGTNKGKRLIDEMVANVKTQISEDDFNATMEERRQTHKPKKPNIDDEEQKFYDMFD